MPFARNPFPPAGLAAAIAFACGVAAARAVRVAPPDALLPALALLALCAALVFRPPLRRRPVARAQPAGAAASAALLALVAAAGLLRGREDFSAPASSLLARADRPSRVNLRCVVAGHPSLRDGLLSVRATVLRLAPAEGIAGTRDAILEPGEDARLLLPCRPGSVLEGAHPGDTVDFPASLRSIRGCRNPGGYDARRAAWLDGIATQISASQRAPVALRPLHGRGAVARALSRARSSLRAALGRLYPAPRDAVMAGLLVGDRSGIPESVTSDFRDAGVIHILSVSGTHVGVLLAVLWMLLGRLPPRFRCLAAVACLWIGAGLTDLSPPVLRSVGMATVLLAGMALQRSASALHACAAAGFAMLALSPRLLLSVGFQLSFLAAFALLLWHRRYLAAMRRLAPRLLARRPARGVVSLFGVTLLAQCGTLPVLVSTFGRVSCVALAANMAVVPLVSLAMTAALPALALEPVSPCLAGCCAACSDAALRCALWTAHACSRLPVAVIGVDRADGAAAWALLGALLIALSGRARRRQRAAIGALAAAAFLALRPFAPAAPQAGGLRIAALDVGQGDAILVRTPRGASLLVDTGPPPGKGGAVRHTLLPALRAMGVDTLDALLITHPDDDHAGGAAELFAAFPVRRCYTTRCDALPAPARAADSVAALRGMPRRALRRGDRIDLDPALRIAVLSPAARLDRATGTNARSVVLLIRYGATAALLAGDCDSAGERAMLAAYGPLLRADLLKAGHHGSGGSSAGDFLAAVRPRHVAISCGRLNRFGHPNAAALRRLAATGARVHRTDLGGAVVFVSDGRALRELPWRDE